MWYDGDQTREFLSPTIQQEGAMTFEQVLGQAIATLQRRGRLTYRTLQRQFHLDDAALDDLKDELIYGQRLAVDEEGKVLVWAGEPGPAAPAAGAPAETAAPAPLAYTPPYLAEKILTSRSALEGERRSSLISLTSEERRARPPIRSWERGHPPYGLL